MNPVDHIFALPRMVTAKTVLQTTRRIELVLVLGRFEWNVKSSQLSRLCLERCLRSFLFLYLLVFLLSLFALAALLTAIRVATKHPIVVWP